MLRGARHSTLKVLLSSSVIKKIARDLQRASIRTRNGVRHSRLLARWASRVDETQAKTPFPRCRPICRAEDQPIWGKSHHTIQWPPGDLGGTLGVNTGARPHVTGWPSWAQSERSIRSDCTMPQSGFTLLTMVHWHFVATTWKLEVGITPTCAENLKWQPTAAHSHPILQRVERQYLRSCSWFRQFLASSGFLGPSAHLQIWRWTSESISLYPAYASFKR